MEKDHDLLEQFALPMSIPSVNVDMRNHSVPYVIGRPPPSLIPTSLMNLPTPKSNVPKPSNRGRPKKKDFESKDVSSEKKIGKKRKNRDFIEESEKKRIRRFKNRQSAQASRERKKEYVKSVENQNKHLKERVTYLEGEVFKLRAIVKQFMPSLDIGEFDVMTTIPSEPQHVVEISNSPIRIIPRQDAQNGIQNGQMTMQMGRTNVPVMDNRLLRIRPNIDMRTMQMMNGNNEGNVDGVNGNVMDMRNTLVNMTQYGNK